MQLSRATVLRSGPPHRWALALGSISSGERPRSVHTYFGGRRRFLSPKHELTPRELAFFTDVAHVGHEAIAAVDQRDCSIVGVARYARFANRTGVAEVAVEVADDFHSMGIATALAGRLVQRARANDFTLLTATTLRENRPALAPLRRLGFRARPSHGSALEFELELEADKRLISSAGTHLHMT